MDIRINQLPVGGGIVASDVLGIDSAIPSGTTRKGTIEEVVAIGRPTATQAEAEAGTNPTKVMTPLTVKQSIASEVGVTIASASQGALASSALQPASIGVSVQAYDDALQSISGLSTAADQMIYTTASNAYATTALTPFGRSILDDADAATMKATLGLVAIASSGSASDLTSGTVPNAQIPARIQETWAGVSDWDSAVVSGWYFGGGGTPNAPDASDYVSEVIAGGGGFAQQYARAFGVDKEFVRERLSGTYGPWRPRFDKNLITMYGAIGDGTTPAQTAISNCIAAQPAQINTITAYDAMPQPLDCEIRIPGGLWHLTAAVDNGGRAVRYIVDSGARFTSGSAGYLNGPVVRADRISFATPLGSLSHACPDSVDVGMGAYDNPPLVNGVVTPSNIGTQIDTIDAVARYTGISSVPLAHSSAATYTATTCVLTTEVPLGRLQAGMYILTSHSPTPYIGMVTSWSPDRKTITVANGWLLRGTNTPTTPSSVGSPAANFSPIEEVYGQNGNVFLLNEGYALQGTGYELGMFNYKVAPTSTEDKSGKTWGFDAANLGDLKCSIAYVARGAFFEGYRATGVDIGFRSAALTVYGYFAPGVGFEHQGEGVGFRLKNSAGTTQAQIHGAGIIDAQTMNLFALVNAANDAAAAAAGVAVNGVYRNGSQLMIRVT